MSESDAEFLGRVGDAWARGDWCSEDDYPRLYALAQRAESLVVTISLMADILEQSAADIDVMFPNDSHPQMQEDLRAGAARARQLATDATARVNMPALYAASEKDRMAATNRAREQQVRAEVAERLLQGLTPGGSDFLVPQRCADWVQREMSSMIAGRVEAVAARQQAERQLAEAQARIAELEQLLFQAKETVRNAD